MADFAIRKLEESAIQNSDQIELNSVEISKLNKERNCFKSANEKLAKYVVKGAQPGMPMFKLARLFDPYQVHQLAPDWTTASPMFPLNFPDQTTLSREWNAYLRIAQEFAAQQDPPPECNNVQDWKTTRVRNFWRSMASENRIRSVTESGKWTVRS